MDTEPCKEPAAGAPTANRLLAALPRDVYTTLEPTLELVNLERGKVLHEPGEAIRELYFPIDSLISITVTMRDGHTAEIGVAGSREVAGVNAFMGGRETTQTRYTVQVEGSAIRADAAALKEAFDTDRRVRSIFLVYTQAMIAQLSQNAACNSLHRLPRRYARWLLEVRDRVYSEAIRLTHEFISDMLGVRRAGISTLAGEFEREGLISSTRGLVHIVDAPRLEQSACECYTVLREEYERLLGRAEPGAGMPAERGQKRES